MEKVLIILGSKSDLTISQKAKDILEKFGIEYKLQIASAHRTPELVKKIVTESKANVFIAIAGLSAHLPGVIASFTIKPVIGVPINASLGGLDALLSIVQMPKGIPCACVGIDRADNAALLAIEILAITDKKLQKRLEEYRIKMKQEIEKEQMPM